MHWPLRGSSGAAACGESAPPATRVEALHLQEKLQKAGYKSKVAKWDSDSDSDESDDSQEDLLKA